MRLRVDSSLCQGHGNCYARFPALFSFDDEGFGSAIDHDLDAAEEDQARIAVTGCPERAIAIG
jgi:ferredoxin